MPKTAHTQKHYIIPTAAVTDEEAMADGAAQSEQIPAEIVLTALFPYVIRFNTEIIPSVDGLCWVSDTD